MSVNSINIYVSGDSAISGIVEFSAQQGDINSRIINANIYEKKKFINCKNNLEPYNIANKTINVVYEYVDENGVVSQTPEYACAKNVDVNNCVTFKIPNAPLLQAGIVNAQLKIYDTENSSLLNSAIFKFEVLKTISAGTSENNDVPILLQLINEVEQLNSSINSAEALRVQAENLRVEEFNGIKTNIEDTVSNANSSIQTAINNANEATSAANNAANLVPNQILTDAVTATNNANFATNLANAAASSANQAATNASNAAETIAGNISEHVENKNNPHEVKYAQLSDKPSLSAVALSGNYDDLSNIPNANDLKAMLLDIFYPVGTIYQSVNESDPSTFIGGTWEKIEGKFLLSSADIYEIGSTGGSATHTLQKSEMPVHDHPVNIVETGYPSYTAPIGGRGISGTTTVGVDSAGYQISATNTGGNQAHNNMPPYLVVCTWKRIA